jgi:myo-inositol 2-dehydrogenase/D-chiro-inositol 1-dehydrogenase
VTEYRHLPALRRLPSVDVIALADVDERRLNGVADRFGIRSRHTDYRRLLDDPSVEAVGVCTPLRSHAAIGLAALESGKHLLIEKPLALSLDDCDRLIERAAETQRTTMVGLNLRWHRLIRQARAIIQRGLIGTPMLTSTVLASYHHSIPPWREQRSEGGGVLCEQAVHMYDLWRFVLGAEVEEVYAVAASGRVAEETASVTARLTNGALVTSQFSWGTGNVCYLDIFGSRARLQVDALRFDGLQRLSLDEHPGDLRARLRRIPSTLGALAAIPATFKDGGDYLATYRAEWRHFLDGVTLRRPVQPTLLDGRRALEVILAAQASSDLGRPVRVAGPDGPGTAVPLTAVGTRVPAREVM